MKQMLTVFRFTYMDAVRKKAYRVSTAIIMVLILILCAIPRAMDAFSSGGEEENTQEASGQTVYFYDAEGLIPGGAQALFASGYSLEGAPETMEEAWNLISENGDALLISVEKGADAPVIRSVCKDFISAPDDETAILCLNTAWRASKLSEAGVSDALIALSQASLPVIRETAGSMDIAGYSLGLVFTFLMFFAVYYYGLSVANSVSMEKTSRVMETLIVSAKPGSILYGKCLAMGAAGLTQLLLIFAFAFASYSLLVPANASFFGLQLSFSGITGANIIALILYFLLGYALYAMLNAVCGASVSRIEDVSSALMPVSMISLVSFYVGYFSSLLGSAGATLDALAKYIPFCSPFGMPFRILTGQTTWTEVGLSLGILLVSIVLISLFCTRLYAASVMHYGKRLKLKDMLKLKP